MTDARNRLAIGRYPSPGSLRAGSFLLWLILFAAVDSHQLALAQTDTGAISGIVNDASAAVVPGATVKLTNYATAQVRVTSTDTSGVYSIPNIPPGVYTLLVQKEGFTANKTSDIHVGLQQVVSQNVILQLGTSVTSVTVSAVQARLQTQSSNVSDLLNTEQLVQLLT